MKGIENGESKIYYVKSEDDSDLGTENNYSNNEIV